MAFGGAAEAPRGAGRRSRLGTVDGRAGAGPGRPDRAVAAGVGPPRRDHRPGDSGRSGEGSDPTPAKPIGSRRPGWTTCSGSRAQPASEGRVVEPAADLDGDGAADPVWSLAQLRGAAGRGRQGRVGPLGLHRRAWTAPADPRPDRPRPATRAELRTGSRNAGGAGGFGRAVAPDPRGARRWGTSTATARPT